MAFRHFILQHREKYITKQCEILDYLP